MSLEAARLLGSGTVMEASEANLDALILEAEHTDQIATLVSMGFSREVSLRTKHCGCVLLEMLTECTKNSVTPHHHTPTG